MSAEQLLRDGNLAEALAQLQSEVRKEPGNAAYRVFLFQLLCVLGDWNRALGQLAVAGDLDPRALAMVQTYREALRCEVFRAEVFASRRQPLAFGKPEPWVAWMIEALEIQTALAERRSAFMADALAAEKEAKRSGKAYRLEDVQRYMGELLQGKKVKRLKPVKW